MHSTKSLKPTPFTSFCMDVTTYGGKTDTYDELEPGDQLHSSSLKSTPLALPCSQMPTIPPPGPRASRGKEESTKPWSSANSGCVPALEVIKELLWPTA